MNGFGYPGGGGGYGGYGGYDRYDRTRNYPPQMMTVAMPPPITTTQMSYIQQPTTIPVGVVQPRPVVMEAPPPLPTNLGWGRYGKNPHWNHHWSEDYSRDDKYYIDRQRVWNKEPWQR